MGGAYLMTNLNLKRLLLIMISLTIISSIAYLYSPVKYPENLLAVSDEELSKIETFGDVDYAYFNKLGSEFKIGTNSKGYVVFKNPEKAYKKIKSDYHEGISIIQRKFFLLPFTRRTYGLYLTYGWQVPVNTNEEREQIKAVISFCGIYENSFNY